MASSKPSFTLAEADECVRLVRLARKAGWWKSVWQRVVGLDDLAEDLSWEAVSPNALAGSMTDGSKRLRDEGSTSKMVTYAPAGSGHDVMKNVPMPSTGYPVGAPSPSVALPDGVPTVERWGQTLVSFGKFKDAKTYAELFDSTDASIASYRNYCVSHFKSGSPGLKDLVSYFKARGLNDASQCVIPGSHTSRHFRED